MNDGKRERLSLAVVLPVLNEEVSLPVTLQSLQAQNEPAERIVVVDGGSHDASVKRAEPFGVEVLVVPGRGRGGQIAAGTLQVPVEVVLIAHADMVFPPSALERVRDGLANDPECPGGCLGHRFATSRWVFRMVEWFDQRRARRGLSFGDQAQFFRRQWIERVGGFPDQPMMEDVELARRLQLLGRPAYLDVPVVVSPRRFEKRGVLRTVWSNWNFRRAYRRHGQAACQAIHREYYGK